MRSSILYFVLLCTVVTGVTRADFLINGSFENGQFAQPGDLNFVTFATGFDGTLVFPGSNILSGWNVQLSPFDPDRALTFSPPAHFGLEWVTATSPPSGVDGSRWVDLNRGGDLWQITQTFTSVPGTLYSFQYSAESGGQRGGATTRFEFVGTTSTVFEDTTPTGGPNVWQTFRHTFLADAATTKLTISAKSIGADPITGMQIDRLSVTAVPEPNASILGMLLASLFILVRRRADKGSPRVLF